MMALSSSVGYPAKSTWSVSEEGCILLCSCLFLRNNCAAAVEGSLICLHRFNECLPRLIVSYEVGQPSSSIAGKMPDEGAARKLLSAKKNDLTFETES